MRRPADSNNLNPQPRAKRNHSARSSHRGEITNQPKALPVPEKGHKFGRLSVIEPTTSLNGRRVFCECRCGTIKPIRVSELMDGRVKSCGCNLVRPGKNNHRWTGWEGIDGSHWCRILFNAAKRQMSVEITIQQAWDLFVAQGKKCALSGVPLVFKGRGVKCTASLDRIKCEENGKVLGYSLGNVQWVHKRINGMKSDLLEEEFIEWCRLVAEANPRD